MLPSGRLSAGPPAAASPARTAPDAGLVPLGGLDLPDHLLLVPGGVRPGAPLVVWFHGAGGSAARSVPTVRAAAERAGALVLLPSSTGSTWDLLTERQGCPVHYEEFDGGHVVRPDHVVEALRWWSAG